MTDSPHREQVLVLDFGAQYGQLIARRVREHNVFCQLVRHDLSAPIVEGRDHGLRLAGRPGGEKLQRPRRHDRHIQRIRLGRWRNRTSARGDREIAGDVRRQLAVKFHQVVHPAQAKEAEVVEAWAILGGPTMARATRPSGILDSRF